jgi:hypothetical protein
MTVETEVAALTSAVNLLTSTVNVSKATLDASVAAAEAAYDSFDDRYLGAKVSAPSLDNDGGSLLTGALYFNSTENAMYVYTGASWVITTNYNNVTAPYTLAQTLNTNGNNVTFGDNGKAIFGAGSDLQIYHDGTTNKVVGSIDVTGTVTMDGLSVDGASSGTLNNVNFLNTNAGATATATRIGLGITNSAGAAYTYIEANEGGVDSYPHLNFYTGSSATKRLEIADNGDVSLYENTGTTAKFFWDASNESLGLNNVNPSATYSVDAAKGIRVSAAAPNFTLQETDAANQTWLMASYAGSFAIRDTTVSGTAYPLQIEAATPSNTLYLDSSGKVGIGTSLPTNGKLVIEESGTSVGSTIRLIGTNTSGSASQVSHITSYQPAGGAAEASALDFKVRGTDPYATPSTVMTLLGGGKVGIGTSSPSQKLSVADGAHITGANATAADTSGSYTLAVGANAGARSAIFAGDVVVSGGVVFGTTGGSVTSKTLDDYEEGTWTPVVSGSTTAGSATYTIQQGVYTKIGNVVRWNARVGYTGHTGTGNMLIWGLPFTNANKYAAGSYSFRDGLTLTAGDQLIVSIPPNNTYIGLYGVASGTDTTAALALDTAVSDISINGVYTV